MSDFMISFIWLYPGNTGHQKLSVLTISPRRQPAIIPSFPYIQTWGKKSLIAGYMYLNAENPAAFVFANADGIICINKAIF